MATDVLHIGLGNFHRAHQCVYFARAGLTVASCSLRTSAAVDALAERGGQFTLLTVDANGATARNITSLVAPVFYPADRGGWLDRFAHPALRFVTLTVTEKGYPRSSSASLDLTSPQVRADLQHPNAPHGTIGVLVEGLARRRAAALGGLPIVCCDNLHRNGAMLRCLVVDFAKLRDADLAEWIDRTCRFPSAMVDCIVPAARREDRQRGLELTGVDDPALVVAEAFRLWVIEDDWIGPRPNMAGPDFRWTKDVAPYDAMKLRLLNAPHTALACLGRAAGLTMINETARDPVFAAYAGRLQRDELAPTVPDVDGYDAGDYAASVLPRFTNPALPHQTLQVATDSTLKLPIRLLAPALERLAEGKPTPLIAMAIAGWMRYSTGTDDNGIRYAISDPSAEEIARRTQAAGLKVPALVDALMDLPGVFPDGLKEDREFRASVCSALGAILSLGVRAAVSQATSAASSSTP